MATSAKGKVIKIYPDSNGCYIILDASPKPLKGLFHLKLTHANYNSLYSLAVTAAVNSYDLQIVTTADIVPTQHGEVVYMTVSW